MPISGDDSDNGRRSPAAVPVYTPIKAHHVEELGTVPETPNSLLPTPPSLKKPRHKEYQRRRARILSSSEEEEADGDTHAAASGRSHLFSGLPVSKRRKKVVAPEFLQDGLSESEYSGKEQQATAVAAVASYHTCVSLQKKPKRLRYNNALEEEEEKLIEGGCGL